MADEQNPAPADQEPTPKTFDEAQVKAMIEEATKGLKAKNDELLSEKKTAAQKARDAKEEADRIAEEAARNSGDIKALEENWRAKLTKAEEAADARIKALSGSVESLTVGAAAKDIAAELAVQGSAKVLERIARDRLAVEMTDDGPSIRVLDTSGKPSATSLAELKAELQSDAALAPLISASKASGAERPGANGRAASKTVTRAAFDAMSQAERSGFSKSGGKVVD